MAFSGESSNETSKDPFSHTLTSKTTIFNIKLYVVIAIVAVSIFLLSFFICVCICQKRSSRKRKMRVKHSSSPIPLVSEQIVDFKTLGQAQRDSFEKEMGHIVSISELEKGQTEIERKVSNASGQSNESGSCSSNVSMAAADVQNIGWGRWYSLKELEIATHGFSEHNVIGEGGYGVVYKGVLPDKSVVAVKNLLNKKGQAEREFKVEVEAIGKVKHKNLVGLIGYCAEGPQRMLVYEYVDNGNLEQWLHGDVGPISPLTWDIRMKIAIGTAKGLAYLHEGLEPKVVHRDVKSSNILLDIKWNPKVSDFGLAKLLGSDTSYVATRVMGTFGYVSPEYASTGMLNEGSDVYSFGVLLMELITGRSPVDYSKPAGEMNLVEWFRGMVASHCGEDIVDPLIEIPPASRVVKRVLLICLRCIDLDVKKRPKMGQIVHLLEADEFPFRHDIRYSREKDHLLPPTVTSRVAFPDKEEKQHSYNFK